MRTAILSLVLAGAALAETFGGFGITILQSNQGVQVVSVIPGTVADGKLSVGDQILAVGEQSLQGKDIAYSTSVLRGEVGSYAVLTIQKQDGAIVSQNLPRIAFRVDDLDGMKIQDWYGQGQVSAEEVQAYADANAGQGYELKGVLQNGQLMQGAVAQLDAVKGVYVGQAPEAPKPQVQAQLASFDLLSFGAKGISVQLLNSEAGRIQVLDAQGKLVAAWDILPGQSGVQQFSWDAGQAPVAGAYSVQIRQGSQQGAWQGLLR